MVICIAFMSTYYHHWTYTSCFDPHGLAGAEGEDVGARVGLIAFETVRDLNRDQAGRRAR